MQDLLNQYDVSFNSHKDDMNTSLAIRYRDEDSFAILAFSTSLILLNRECRLEIINSRHTSVGENNNPYYLYEQNFAIIFTDEAHPKTPPSGTLILTQTQEITIKCHKWYGEGVENTDPFIIRHSIRPDTTFLVKIKTTAFESQPKRRKVDISIWTKIT